MAKRRPGYAAMERAVKQALCDIDRVRAIALRYNFDINAQLKVEKALNTAIEDLSNAFEGGRQQRSEFVFKLNPGDTKSGSDTDGAT